MNTTHTPQFHFTPQPIGARELAQSFSLGTPVPKAAVPQAQSRPFEMGGAGRTTFEANAVDEGKWIFALLILLGSPAHCNSHSIVKHPPSHSNQPPECVSGAFSVAQSSGGPPPTRRSRTMPTRSTTMSRWLTPLNLSLQGDLSSRRLLDLQTTPSILYPRHRLSSSSIAPSQHQPKRSLKLLKVGFPYCPFLDS